jgi:hypothetical protein
MALTTLATRWTPDVFWTLPANLEPVKSLATRWTPDVYWRSPVGVDSAAPVITSDVSPGSIAPTQIVQITAADAGGIYAAAGIVHFSVFVIDTHSGNEELAYDVRSSVDYDVGPAYDTDTLVTPNANGFTVSVRRNDGVRAGWPWSGFTIVAVAVDRSGNTTRQTFAYTVSPNYETAAAVAFTPAAPATIGYAASVTVEVTETAPDSIANVRLFANFTSGADELIFDGAPGAGAQSGYSVVQGAISGGWSWQISRTGGWKGNFTLEARVRTLNPVSPDSSASGVYTVTPASSPAIVFNPVSGSSFEHDTATPVSVDVTDAAAVSGVKIYTVGTTRSELVFDAAPGGSPQIGFAIVQTLISGGRRYAITRTGGWLEDFALVVYGTNTNGLTANAQASYTLLTYPEGGVDTTPPETSNPQPPPGTVITTSTPLSIDVTDESGEFRRVLIAVVLTGLCELAWDGDAWLGNYAGGGCTRTPISGGFRFTVLRDGGWPSSPTLRVFAFDQGGNEV